MIAVFSLIDKNGDRLSEDALREDPARAAELLGDSGSIEGVLHIEDPATGIWASLGDTLPVLMENFCLEGLNALRAAARNEIDFFEHEEELTVVVADGQVSLDSTRFGKRSFPEAAYFTALAECGARYLALLASTREAPADAAGTD